jgi:hypothetical protein
MPFEANDRNIYGDVRTVGVVPIPPRPAQQYLVGLDLGQAQDYTAFVVVEQHRQTPARYQVRYLHRFALGTAYPAMVVAVQQLLQSLPPAPDRGAGVQRMPFHLVVDATGVGRPVIDMLVQAKLQPIAVSIHGGDTVHREGLYWRVPKRDLVGVLQVLLQTQRLKIAQALPLAQTLVQELLRFRVRIDPQTAHDSYSAWREGLHDDLVLALALACWWGERWRPVGVWALRV